MSDERQTNKLLGQQDCWANGHILRMLVDALPNRSKDGTCLGDCLYLGLHAEMAEQLPWPVVLHEGEPITEGTPDDFARAHGLPSPQLVDSAIRYAVDLLQAIGAGKDPILFITDGEDPWRTTRNSMDIARMIAATIQLDKCSERAAYKDAADAFGMTESAAKKLWYRHKDEIDPKNPYDIDWDSLRPIKRN